MPKVEPSIASMQRPTSHMETSIDRVQTSMPQVEPSIAEMQRRTPSIPACTDLVQASMSQAELFISAMQQRSSATQARIDLVQNSAQAIHSMNTRDGTFQWQHATMESCVERMRRSSRWIEDSIRRLTCRSPASGSNPAAACRRWRRKRPSMSGTAAPAGGRRIAGAVAGVGRRPLRCRPPARRSQTPARTIRQNENRTRRKR